MHHQSIAPWAHAHTFQQDRVRSGEKKARLVLAITLAMMVVEIAAGLLFGSMALLADGLHMGSHAAALGVSAAAYLFARRYAGDGRFCFGTGKVNVLAGYTSAILLAVFAFAMAWQSAARFVNPVRIEFDQAIMVAVIGLAVNVGSAWILHENHARPHGHPAAADHNLRSAYLHVLADAVTSLLAIAALVGGKFFGLAWMDALMGLVGAGLVGRWSFGLLRDSGRVLLDEQGPGEIRSAISQAIETRDGDRISDLHLWSIGPGIFAAAISIVAAKPKPPEEYKRLLPDHLGLVHATVEVQPCRVG
jgi:cation diffusion facilitator family transporter